MKDSQHSEIALAIKLQIKKALDVFLLQICKEFGYPFITAIDDKRKILIVDDSGRTFGITTVIANESVQPIILVESRYCDDEKNETDETDWLCTALPSIRRRYQSIRSSIAVLAGNWSSSSLAMMKSFDINIFLIPFERICELLAHHNINFDWGEKDRVTARDAWERYSQLTEQQQRAIGEEMVALVKDDLRSLIVRILDDSVKRNIEKVTIELHSNLGEVKTYEFGSIAEAVELLNSKELKEVFLTTNSLTLFDPPPEIEYVSGTE